MRFIPVLLLASLSLSAQLLPPIRTPFFPPELQKYLELTPEQVTSIGRLNAVFQQFSSEKAQRAAQVQREIFEETAKPQLDAMALGVRHLELEAIRRARSAEQQKTYEEVQKILTPAQKTKVQALVEAMRLQPRICEAQAQNILPASAFPAAIVPVNRIGSGSGVISGGFADFLLGPSLLGCPNFLPNVIGGDFTVRP